MLLGERPRDIYRVQLRDQICSVYQTVNDVSTVNIHTFRGKKAQQHINRLINRIFIKYDLLDQRS